MFDERGYVKKLAFAAVVAGALFAPVYASADNNVWRSSTTPNEFEGTKYNTFIRSGRQLVGFACRNIFDTELRLITDEKAKDGKKPSGVASLAVIIDDAPPVELPADIRLSQDGNYVWSARADRNGVLLTEFNTGVIGLQKALTDAKTAFAVAAKYNGQMMTSANFTLTGSKSLLKRQAKDCLMAGPPRF